MKELKMFVITGLCALSLIRPGPGNAAIGQDGLHYKDEFLSVDIRNTSLTDVLESISKSADIDIYVFDGGNSTITSSFSGRSLQDGLRSILKGVNYAIEYPHQGGKTGVHWLKSLNPLEAGSDSPIENNVDVYTVPDEKQDSSVIENNPQPSTIENAILASSKQKNQLSSTTKIKSRPLTGKGNKLTEKVIRQRIEALDKLIESGNADKEYTRWVSIKGKNFVKHPTEMLQDYKEQLTELTGK
jgi:hypothetical protein